MKKLMLVFFVLAVNTGLIADNIVPLSVSWNAIESRWARTSDKRLLFIMSLNYPSKRLPSLSEEEYMACLHEYAKRHPDSKDKKVVNYLKTNPDLNKTPAILVVEIALKNKRITPKQASFFLDKDKSEIADDSTPKAVEEILLAIPELTPVNILDDGSKEYTLSENHTRVVSPDGTVQDYIYTDDEFRETLNKLLKAADWMPARTHIGDGALVETVNINYSDFGIDPELILERKFVHTKFLASIIIQGGHLTYRSFDQIGSKMEQASFLTPSVYKKNGFDKDAYFVAWWLGEKGNPIENESEDTVRLDFDK